MEELISIIIPVYKVEKYLDKCVQSVVSQTYRKLEIILVDDGSPDRCGEMCDAWAEKDNRIRVIHKENGGLSSARNAGIDASTGEYLMFIDSDDYIASEMAEKLYEALIKYDTTISICNFIRIREDGHIIPSTETTLTDEVFTGEEAVFRLIKSPNVSYVISCNKLYKRNLFLTLRYPIGKIHEDEFLAHHLFGLCEKVSSISDICYYYRTHDGSIMANKNYKEKLYALESAADRLTFCKEIGLNEALSSWYSDLAFRFSDLGSVPKNLIELKPEVKALHKIIRSNLPLCKFCKKKQAILIILVAIHPGLYRFVFKLTHHHHTHTENHP